VWLLDIILAYLNPKKLLPSSCSYSFQQA
jgi:hypothetical protein